MNALNENCGDPHSPASKRLVVQLSQVYSVNKATYLHNAVLWDHFNIVRCGLEAKISANVRGNFEWRRPALVEAALAGRTRILKLLLEAGADPVLVDTRGVSALDAAAQNGYLDCLEALVAAGADANQSNVLGITPLVTAITHKRSACVRALLPLSDLRLFTHDGLCALHSCVLSASEECFELLLPRMSDLDIDIRTLPGVIDEAGHALLVSGHTALILACEKGQQQMAKALLKRGADRMAKDSVLRTSCHHAALHGHLSCVTLLIGQPGRVKMTPADVNAADVEGCTPLHLASAKGHDKICAVLLEAGARLDALSSQGYNPLMAAQHFHPTNAALHALLSGQGPAQPTGTVCDHCGKTAAQASVNSLKGCSQCHGVRYCGTACSAAAWPGHKKACKARAKEREAATRTIFVEPPGAAGQAAPNN